jgi:acyl transferase domain-containing protein
LASWHIEPAAVTGHSSGEIAAAYSCGSLSFEDALTVAYFRGYHASRLSQKHPSVAGAMIAVGLSESEAITQISEVPTVHGKLTVACANSASSVTISGDRSAVDELQKILEAKKTFNRLLPVDIAYHSHHMSLLSKVYLASISKIHPRKGKSEVRFWSSVTGDLSTGEDLESAYVSLLF